MVASCATCFCVRAVGDRLLCTWRPPVSQRVMIGYTSPGTLVKAGPDMLAKLTTADDWCDAWRQGSDAPVGWAEDNHSTPSEILMEV